MFFRIRLLSPFSTCEVLNAVLHTDLFHLVDVWFEKTSAHPPIKIIHRHNVDSFTSNYGCEGTSVAVIEVCSSCPLVPQLCTTKCNYYVHCTAQTCIQLVMIHS